MWSHQIYHREGSWDEYGYWHSYNDTVTITQSAADAGGIRLTVRRVSNVTNHGLAAASFTFRCDGASVTSASLPGASNGAGYDSKDVSTSVVFPASWVGKTVSISGSETGSFIFGGYAAFTLGISADSHCPVTVSRSASPKAGAQTGRLTDGAAIYSADELSVSFTPDAGYSARVTLNGAEIMSGAAHSVSGSVTVASVAEPMATISGYTGYDWMTGLIYVYTGSEWALHQAHIFNGESWDKYY